MSNVLRDTFRGLVNTLTGLGGYGDKASSVNSQWSYTPLDPNQLEASYRSNWMVRKAVDIPAFDMLREGWSWSSDKDTIERIEAAERRFSVVSAVHKALKWSRLYGGAAIIIHDGSSRPEEPLGTIGKGKLKFLQVVSRNEITSESLDLDPVSEFYMQPTMYQLVGALTGSVRIHPSRVIRFLGAEIPRLGILSQDIWADSIVDVIDQAIRDATATHQGIASLVQEAKIDIFKFPDFMTNVLDARYRDQIEARVQLTQRTKGILGAVMMDATDEWQQKSVSFTQLPEVMQLFLQIVSGAADIPITRFLGQSPGGLNATGESDMMNYYNRIKSNQNLDLRPPLQRLLDIVARSEFGKVPSDMNFEFRPLHQMTPKEVSEIMKSQAESVKTINETGLIPREVMEKAQANAMIESGAWPGFESAYEVYTDGQVAEDDFGTDVEGDDRRAANTNLRVIPGAAFADGAPKPLYVRRDVKNKADIVKWAKSQGFETVQRDLHVTLVYSKDPVDFMTMGASWEEEVIIAAGGPREIEIFGEDCVVLRFVSDSLAYRVEQMRRAGASSDFPDYKPHITITLKRGDVDIDKVTPYNGRIVLGPEIFEPLDLDTDWKSKVVEV